MADQLVTQVARPGAEGGAQTRRAPPNVANKRRGGFLQCICSCFSATDGPDQTLAADGAPSSKRRDQEERQRAMASPTAGGKRCLLPPPTEQNKGKKCLVLDLDETLVHSSFHPTAVFDFQIKVEIDGIYHDVYVAKRPGCEIFLERAAEKYELVVFTASLAKYADPVLDALDPKGHIFWRLFRDSCVGAGSQFVKDMSILGRPAETAMILDNSPTSYMFQPEQAIPIESWFDDPDDRMLLQLLPILDDLAECDNVIHGLRKYFQH